jgi:hypothetical protein
MKEMEFCFTVFVERSEGHNIAHCLEMGLVAVHEDRDELLNTMNKLIVRQLLFALENNNPADIYHSAPADVWGRFRALMANNPGRRSDRTSAQTIDIQGWQVPVLANEFAGMPEPVYA